MTGAAGGGPVRRAAGWPGYCLIQASRCVPSHRRKTTARSSLGSPAPRWPPGICARSRTSSPGAPVTTEPPAPPRRPVSRTAMLRLRVPAGGWSAPAARVAGAGGLLPGPPRGTARPATHPGLVPSAPAWSRASAGARENAPKSRSGPASRRQRSARRPGSTAAIASSPARRARASSRASPAMRPGTAATRARPAATSAVPGQPPPGRRFTAGVEPGEPARGLPQSAHLVTETVRDQVPPV